MQRRQRRKLEQIAKNRLDRLELEKKFITKNAIAHGQENPFDKIFFYKNFWIGYYRKSGLKLAPFREFRVLLLKLTHRYDTLVIGFLGYSLVIKNWSIRSKKKPAGSIGKFTFKLVKDGKKDDQKS
jgi:hypothetical protein